MPARPAGRQMWRGLPLLLPADAAELLPTAPRPPIPARAPAAISAPAAAGSVPEARAPLARTVGTRPDIPVPFAARDAAAPDWTLAVLNARAAWNVSVGAGG